MKNKSYTLGEIARGGLMLNEKGEPYASKGAISVAVRMNNVPFTTKKTPFGETVEISEADLKAFNKSRKKAK